MPSSSLGDAKGLKLAIILAKLSLNLWPFGPFQIVYIYTRTVYSICFCAAIIYKSSVSGIFPDVQYFPFQLIIVLVLGSATFFFLHLNYFLKYHLSSF
jgi:hypothetical protein